MMESRVCSISTSQAQFCTIITPPRKTLKENWRLKTDQILKTQKILTRQSFLAPMAKKDRKQFELAMTKSFKTDPVESTLVGWTPLGHFEIQRKRERVPLRLSLKL